MKKVFLNFVLLALIIVSCKDDDAASCPPHYFGEDCSSLFNSPFSGTWNGSEQCDGDESAYTVTMTPNAVMPLTFEIAGLWDEPEAISIVTIDENDRFTFTGERQPLGNSGFNIEIHSSTLNATGNQIIVNFSIYSASIFVKTCMLTCTK